MNTPLKSSVHLTIGTEAARGTCRDQQIYPDMAKAQSTRNSTCNCGNVVITVTGVDKGSVLCHCSNCANASGSSFAHNHRFMPAELKVTKGESDLKEYADTNTKSGNKLYRHFCSNCVCIPMQYPILYYYGFVYRALAVC